jgi:hypothetical protein
MRYANCCTFLDMERDIGGRRPQSTLWPNWTSICDEHRSPTYIRNQFPQLDVEPGFTEEDELWTEQREALDHLYARLKKAMDQLFWVEETCERFIILLLCVWQVLTSFISCCHSHQCHVA